MQAIHGRSRVWERGSSSRASARRARGTTRAEHGSMLDRPERRNSPGGEPANTPRILEKMLCNSPTGLCNRTKFLCMPKKLLYKPKKLPCNSKKFPYMWKTFSCKSKKLPCKPAMLLYMPQKLLCKPKMMPYIAPIGLDIARMEVRMLANSPYISPKSVCMPAISMEISSERPDIEKFSTCKPPKVPCKPIRWAVKWARGADIEKIVRYIETMAAYMEKTAPRSRRWRFRSRRWRPPARRGATSDLGCPSLPGSELLSAELSALPANRSRAAGSPASVRGRTRSPHRKTSQTVWRSRRRRSARSRGRASDRWPT